MAMTVNNSLYSNYAAQKADAGIKKRETDNQAREVGAKSRESEVRQPQLSRAAQKLLEKLRSTYGNMDFLVADFSSAEEAKTALSRGTKEVSVLFSGEELEKMASDEKYEKECMDRVQGALRMSEEINRKYGFESAFRENGENAVVTRIGISFNADGTTTFFAELEKSGADRRERLEKMQEDKRAQRKEEAKKAEKEKQEERLQRKAGRDIKRTAVQADSMEEFLQKIRKVDWNTIHTADMPDAGRKFDYSV